jgi:hypothetical protein
MRRMHSPAGKRADAAALEAALEAPRMHIHDAQVYAEFLDRVVCKHSLEPVSIEFVDDVADWCAGRGVLCPDGPGGAAGMAIRADQTGAVVILIRRCIDANYVAGIKGRMLAGGFDAWARKLDTPESFLTHLVLHELAHLVPRTEDECDAWAFHKTGFR